jgi:hypothetical protein
MSGVLAAIEQIPVSVWMREDYYAYFVALIFHSSGMALLVGGGIVISLRGLGMAGTVVLQQFRGFFPVMWLGAALAIASGLLLLCAYPAKALTNPVFGIKLVCLIAAALLLPQVMRGSRTAAAVALALWLAGVAAGKLLLHTYTVLMVS